MRNERSERQEIGNNNLMQQALGKIARRTAKVIEHFELGDDLADHILNSMCHDNVLFDDQFIFKFNNTPQKGKKISTSDIKLKKVESPLEFYAGNNKLKQPPECVIQFDENQKVISITLTYTYLIKGFQFEQSVINLEYDANYNLIRCKFTENYVNMSTKKLTTVNTDKKVNMLCDEKEEIFLINMRFNRDNTMLQEILPELSVPSAYDFNSDDYKSRLEMVDMILV